MTLDPETEAWLDRLVEAAPMLTERQSAEIRHLFQDRQQPKAGDDAS